MHPVLRSPAFALLALLAPACDRAPSIPATGGLVVLNQVDGRPFFDFGRVEYGSKHEHVFLIRNDETSPVTVRDLIPSCGCATPRIRYLAANGEHVEGRSGKEVPVITLPPGATAELIVRVDTDHVREMNLDKLAMVRMRSDSASTPYLTFEMHLVVERLMRAVPGAIALGPTPQSAGASGRADVVNDVPGSSTRVKGIASIEGPFTATVDETEIAGVPVWIVVATAKPNLPIGPAHGKIMLSVTGEDGTGEGAPFSIPVSAQISPELVVRPPVLAFGTIAKGTAARVVAELVSLIPGERVLVTSHEIRTEPPGAARWIASEATPVDPEDEGSATRWTIVLQSWPKLEEPLFSGTLVLRTDHPHVGEIRVPFSGAVR
ncbi:MAG: DUF1573 domain-containing protein [Planctomycetota bacterium]